MDNQQEILTDSEAGWLAGIIEGDGYITIITQKNAKVKRNSGLVVAPKIGITNQDGLIIERASDLFKKLGASGIWLVTEKAKDCSHKINADILHLSTARISACYKILIMILPHLAGQKAGRARLLLKFVESRLAHKHFPYNADELQIIKQFVEMYPTWRRNKGLEKFLNDYTPGTEGS